MSDNEAGAFLFVCLLVCLFAMIRPVADSGPLTDPLFQPLTAPSLIRWLLWFVI